VSLRLHPRTHYDLLFILRKFVCPRDHRDQHDDWRRGLLVADAAKAEEVERRAGLLSLPGNRSTGPAPV